ncbi:MAG: hypothetical protein MUO31_13040 [Thermodesulfovibrionales bacterium]|nr:hypothetical protein [Thermodesulfovibrionales bacterium]
MFKKILTSLMVLALVCSVSLGQPNIGTAYHEIQIVDEMGENVTDITSVAIYGAGGTTESTIYAGRNKTLAMTNPVTTSSTNTTLSNGYMSWWGPGNYDFSITDGTNTHTNSGHRDRTNSEGRIMFPSFLQSISSTTYTDAQTITLGTGADWVINAGTTDDLLTFTPATDGAVFRVGLSAGTKSADLQWYTASGVGLLISESANTLGITGLTTSINASSNYDTSINTGTSTGAVSIGSSTSGAWLIDGTSTGTINADDSIAVTVSAGTIGIAATGGDITIDGTDSSVIIRGTEEAADAVLITADGTAGGVHIDSGTGDITLDSGDDIFLEANTGTGDVISVINTKGTSTSSIVVTSTVGGIDLDSALSTHITSSEETGDAIYIYASGTAGGVDITSGTGDIALVSTDDITLTTATAAGDQIYLLNSNGTADDAIYLAATAGGITLNAAAGSVDIEAVGGTDGDIGINAGDDMTITAAGDLTFTITGAMVLPNDILLRAVVAVSSAEVLDLADTPKSIIASPAGTDLTIEFVRATIALDYGTAAYAEASAPDDLVFRYTDGSGAIVSGLVDATGFATATADSIVFVGPTVASAAGAAVASVAVTEAASTDQALVLHNTGADWITGDSPLVVIVYYRLHTTAELGL